MDHMQIFNNSEFGSVRTIEENGVILFCAKDIAIRLGYCNTRDAIQRHCKGIMKRDALTSGGDQSLGFIPEPDVYRLIIRSKLPAAQRFERWVVEDILPTIRKKGIYAADELLDEMIRNPKLGTRLFLELQAEQKRRLTIEK